jgi:hypothetical protein
MLAAIPGRLQFQISEIRLPGAASEDPEYLDKRFALIFKIY